MDELFGTCVLVSFVGVLHLASICVGLVWVIQTHTSSVPPASPLEQFSCSVSHGVQKCYNDAQIIAQILHFSLPKIFSLLKMEEKRAEDDQIGRKAETVSHTAGEVCQGPAVNLLWSPKGIFVNLTFFSLGLHL